MMLTAVLPVQAEQDRRLVIGLSEGGWPPFDQVTDGRFSGLSAALLSRALAATSPGFEVREFADRNALQQAACRGEVDVVPHAKFLYVRDTQQALAAIAAGRADLYVGLRPAIEYAIRQDALQGLVLFDAHAEPMS